MTSRGLFLVAAAALTTVIGNLLMRTGVMRAGGLRIATDTILLQLISLAKQPAFAMGAFLYVLSAVIWFSVISTEPLSTAYPILVSMTFVLVTAGSVYFFDERLSLVKVLGILWILGGIWFVARK